MWSKCAVIVFGVAISLGAGCRGVVEAPLGPRHVRIATAARDGGYYAFGEALARVYNAGPLPMDASAVPTAGSAANMRALDEGTAEIAFARADVAYRAFRDGTRGRPQPHARLRGIAILFENVLHYVARADRPSLSLAGLRGRRIGVVVPAPGRASARPGRGADTLAPIRYADLVAAGGAFAVDEVQSVSLGLGDLAQALESNEITAGFFMSGYPVPQLDDLASRLGVRLLEIDPRAAALIRDRYPFYKPTLVPAETYTGQPHPVRTIAVENLLVTREDLDEELVYVLTKALFENLPRLAQDHEAASQVDPDVAPATPIPLHPGAARYYRERELLK